MKTGHIHNKREKGFGLAVAQLAVVLACCELSLGGLGVGMSANSCVELTNPQPKP